MKNHPIMPSSDLIDKWRGDLSQGIFNGYCWPEREFELAIKAAEWGADQELEACIKLLADLGGDGEMIRRYRRPNPPSLKEQAFAELELLKGDANAHGLGFDAPTIRRALEQLND